MTIPTEAEAREAVWQEMGRFFITGLDTAPDEKPKAVAALERYRDVILANQRVELLRHKEDDRWQISLGPTDALLLYCGREVGRIYSREQEGRLPYILNAGERIAETVKHGGG